MSGLTLRVYETEYSDKPVILCDECAEWLKEGYQLQVEEKIAGTFHTDHCEECGKN